MKSSIKVNLIDLEFIPEKPYKSKVISYKNDNLWELNELWPKDQIIDISFKSIKIKI